MTLKVSTATGSAISCSTSFLATAGFLVSNGNGFQPPLLDLKWELWSRIACDCSSNAF